MFVIYSNTSRNNGGLRPVVTTMPVAQILAAADFQLAKCGETLATIAGVEKLTDAEALPVACDVLNVDGRLFAAFDNASEFVDFAEQFVGDRARELVGAL